MSNEGCRQARTSKSNNAKMLLFTVPPRFFVPFGPLSVALRRWRRASSRQTSRRRTRCLRTANPNRRWSWSAEWVWLFFSTPVRLTLALVSGRRWRWRHFSAQVEKEKTTGDGWFNMKAPELSQELKGDLQLLKMRGSLDSKRFYKKNDRDGFPKYFQVGVKMNEKWIFLNVQFSKTSTFLPGSGWYRGGQPSGLLSFPYPQEEQEENHGGGAAGGCRVQTVSLGFVGWLISWSEDHEKVLTTGEWNGLHEASVTLKLAFLWMCSSLQGFQTDFSLSRKNKKKYQQIVAEKVAQAAGKKNKRRRFHQKSNVKKQWWHHHLWCGLMVDGDLVFQTSQSSI